MRNKFIFFLFFKDYTRIYTMTYCTKLAYAIHLPYVFSFALHNCLILTRRK